MDSCRGSADVFFTITPPDVRTLAISVLSGVVSVESAMNLNATEIPSHAARVAISGRNLAVCSEHFDAVCSALFNSMVCVDRNTGFSRPEGGLVGVCRGYIGVVESKGSGTLHMHGITYIGGLPRSVLDNVRGCNDPDTVGHFKERFGEFAESVVICSLPVSVGVQEPLPCLNGNALMTEFP